jgi:hypothetical protein
MRTIFICVCLTAVLMTASAQSGKPSYSDSVVLAPLYIEYATVSDKKFADEAAELRRRIGDSPHVMVGFAAFLNLDYDGTPELNSPIRAVMLASTLREADLIVDRARANHLVTHIGLISGFFHGWNRLREAAIRDDVRNAQWFADGAIGQVAALTSSNEISRSIWITPSTYAKALRARMEETVRIVSKHLAERMAASPDTLVSLSGDGEVELTWERNLGPQAITSGKISNAIYTDYSPFAVAEFRDSLRAAYKGDRTPNTDDDHDGHTFNRDFGQSFTTWRLKYFDESGPIPLASYIALPRKLPDSGVYYVAGGFDAPRMARTGNRYWEAWMQFRRRMIAGYVRDFARWVTTSAAPGSGFTIPSNRFYSHQIPAEFLFEQPDNIRLYTSASPLESAFIDPFGSIGVTAYNMFDGKRHIRTATPELFSHIVARSPNWGVLEYNPSMPSQPAMPPGSDEGYYLEQLRMLYSFRPHVIVPFPWTELPEHKSGAIQDRPFERALAEFVKEIGTVPWATR